MQIAWAAFSFLVLSGSDNYRMEGASMSQRISNSNIRYEL